MKAIALLSGGLDSCLALKLVQNQGIEIIAIYFSVLFCKQDKAAVIKSLARKTAKDLNIELLIEYLGEEYFEIIKNPKHGYGKNLNPCIDCRIFMFKRAKRLMEEKEASFVISGEVLGQRPMSQHKRALRLIEEKSGLKGVLLRPLSAKLLSLTIPENKGWIKKNSLLDIYGRSRKIQIELAAKLGIREYSWPGGGCLLADSYFCRRLKDAFIHKIFSLSDIELLKIGRHFRVGPRFKLVVGRDEQENKKLVELAQKQDSYFEPEKLPGPVGIGRGIIDEETKKLSLQIIARYTSLNDEVKILFGSVFKKTKEIISVKGIDERQLRELRL